MRVYRQKIEDANQEVSLIVVGGMALIFVMSVGLMMMWQKNYRYGGRMGNNGELVTGSGQDGDAGRRSSQTSGWSIYDKMSLSGEVAGESVLGAVEESGELVEPAPY